MSKDIDRRDFLKLSAIVPFSGLVLAKSDLLPSKRDYVSAELQECSDYSTQSSSFIRHFGFWFFADQNIIKYCPEDKLAWDKWSTINIGNYDTFDFWLKIEGSLYWVGENKRWEIQVTPEDKLAPVSIRIQLSGYWDGENWSS